MNGQKNGAPTTNTTTQQDNTDKTSQSPKRSNDGNNQESCSEDLHCWYSIYQYAKNTNQPK